MPSAEREALKYGWLVERGWLDSEELRQAIAQAQSERIDTAAALMGGHAIPKAQVLEALGHFYGCATWEPGTGLEPESALRVLPAATIRRHAMLPLSWEGGLLTVALADPADAFAIDDARFVSGAQRLEVRVALQQDILDWIARHCPGEPEPVPLPDGDDGPDLEPGAEDEALDELEPAPVITLANQILIDALRRGASHLYLEPAADRGPLKVRLRVNGVLDDLLEAPGSIAQPLLRRYKILACLDIASRRRPQSGRIRFRHAGHTVDLLVQTIPVGRGEDVVIRFDCPSPLRPLDALGLAADARATLERLVSAGAGVLLAAGPSGSGRSTLLHALLARLDARRLAVYATEGPCPYPLPGVRQVPVSDLVRRCDAVSSVLHAGADAVLAGPLDRSEDVEAVLRGASRRRLILASIHTASAVVTPERLSAMDAAFGPLAAEALLAVVGVRLPRRLCMECRQSYPASDADRECLGGLLGPESAAARGLPRAFTLHRCRGCPRCGETGYHGQVGLHELFVPSLSARALIARGGPEAELRRQALADGFTTLGQDAVRKLLDGETDLSQVLAARIGA